jgi:hypothetical protein
LRRAQLAQSNGNVINYRQAEKKILDEILGKNIYDSRLRPPGLNESCKNSVHKMKHHSFLLFSASATYVHVNIFVRDFIEISDVKMVRHELTIPYTHHVYLFLFKLT